MIIDFHTHTYPREIAGIVISRLSGESHVKAYTDATEEGLVKSCEKNNISKCVVLPVVTAPSQTDSINKIAMKHTSSEGRIISFGGIHPDNENYRNILAELAREGVPGIKLHPVFQKTYFDDIKYMRIVDCACEYGLIISVHAGLDINDSTAMYSTVPRIRTLLKTAMPDKIILAHMGGHLCWNEAEDMLNEYMAERPNNKSLYLDTAFCLPSPVESQNIKHKFMTNEQFVRMVRLVGSEHVLFGTDSPWTDHAPSIEAIINSGLTQKEVSCILGNNAKDLLNLSN